jgi:preprotein translocase subunit SecG
LQYLQKQIDFLPEGQRPDLILPSRMFDQFERKKTLIENTKEIKGNIQAFFSLRKADETSSNIKINFDEELGILTQNNYDIYTGAIIAESQVKLKSMRNIPIHRVSKDIIASIMFFIDDIHEYKAKQIAYPVFKSFSDVFAQTNTLNSNMNKKRSEVMNLYMKTRILDEVPEGFANNPALARVLSFLRKLSVNKLLLDPLGAMVNLANGELQIFIENTISKKAWANFVKASVEATKWQYAYDKDALLFSQHKLSIESQLIDVLGMIPQGIDLSERMSKLGVVSDLKAIAMQPREQTEIFMGIQLGLSIVENYDIQYNGKKLKIKELYELDKYGNIKLKDEYLSLKDDWDIIDGKNIQQIRNTLINTYSLLQGNFYDFNQSYISNTAIGKSAELLKRWFMTGYIRRFQGEVLDPFLGSEREGYHWTMLKFLYDMGTSLKNDGASGAKEHFNLVMTKKQKNNLRKSVAELTYIFLISMFLIHILKYDSDDEDKNKKLKKMSYWEKVAILIAIRAKSEAGTFIPLPFFGLGLQETFRAFLDPFGVIKGTVLNISGSAKIILDEIMYAMGFDIPEKNMRYQRDMTNPVFPSLSLKDKNDRKIWVLILNTLGYTGYTFDPETYIKTIDSLTNRIK